MKVNERRTVVGVDWPLCVPPTVERDRRAWWGDKTHYVPSTSKSGGTCPPVHPMIDAHVYNF